ncbi:SDR family oxidoreductase [Paraburkholderia sp. MMS20-SJTR3]|uniref:SDR family oxidoreductase n=1 Tax=Paraburkholderia sejongensis TaxID=2886946 RepID=A0ABS8JSF1_9BURK|nr:SDR family oxidoreductase [Paraburkholderia sp. MMS20-SJTR3]MCC8392793.1 SDR family oxidoreductase [Paraburkholderia sp. MMS20-SJTR3]
MTKTWFITGTSSGLGRLLAERLLQRGDRVVATLRRDGPLVDLQKQFGDRLHVLKLDVTDFRAVRANIAAAFEAMGRIDVLVNNAGYGLFGAAEELTDDQIDRQIATNLTGSIQLIRACLPHFRQQGGGRVLQLSSTGGQVAYPNFSVYHATKWGIEGFVEAVAQETAGFGIDFILAEPGPTATNFGTNLDRASAMPEYDATPSGEMRRAFANGGSFAKRDDAGDIVAQMIAAADSEHPPLRLVLGDLSYQHIEHTLAARLDSVRAQRAPAASQNDA